MQLAGYYWRCLESRKLEISHFFSNEKMDYSSYMQFDVNVDIYSKCRAAIWISAHNSSTKKVELLCYSSCKSPQGFIWSFQYQLIWRKCVMINE
jgi:hypothetical protein